MKALRLTPAAPPTVEATDALLDDLDRFAAETTDAGALYARLLRATTDAIGAVVGERWIVGTTSPTRAERVRSAEIGLAATPPAPVEAIHRAETPRVADRWLLCPVSNAIDRVAVLAFHVSADAAAINPERRLDFVAAVAEIADRFETGRQANTLRSASRRIAEVDDFALRLQSLTGQRAIAAAVAEAAQRSAGADRAAVLLRRGVGSWRVAAVTGASRHATRSLAIRRIESLANAVIHDGGGLLGGVASTVPPLGDERAAREDPAPQVAEALDRYQDESGAASVFVAPCASNDADGISQVALHVESYRGALADDAVDRLAPLARHADAALRRVTAAGWLAGSLRSSSWLMTAVVAFAAILAAVAALSFVPAELTVRAEGRFVPADRARVFAPTDGVVERLLVGHGDAVAAGQPIVRLRSSELEIGLEEVREAIAVTEREIASLETAKLRGRLERDSDDFDAAALAARVAALKEQRTHQLRRRELLEAEATRLAVASPVDGRVVSWRPEDYLADRPVRRGDRLLEIAAMDGPWRIEIDLADHRVGPVLGAERDDLRVRYVVKASPENEHAARVVRVAEATRVNADGRPVVRIDVEPAEIEGLSPRSGLAVVAKIDCGKHRLGYVWFHEAWKAVLRRLF